MGISNIHDALEGEEIGRDCYDTVLDAIDSIDAFEAKCNAADYTDTGEVWEFLQTLREQFRKAIGEQ